MRWWWGRGGLLAFLARGIAPSSLSSDHSKENFRFLAAGWVAAWLGGGVWGGGGGRPPPPSPSCPWLTPPPAMVPHVPSSSPPAYRTSYIRAHSPSRKRRGVTQTPLTTRAVSESWRPRKTARPKGPGPRCGVGPLGVLPESPQRLARPPGWAWHASRSPRRQSAAV